VTFCGLQDGLDRGNEPIADIRGGGRFAAATI